MGSEYPELHEQRDIVRRWLASEEEGFGRTLEQGLKRLDELIARARESRCGGDRRRRRVPAARHVRVPDRPHARDRRRAWPRRRRGGLRVADGGPAHAGARGRRGDRGWRPACVSAPPRCRAARASPPSSSATRRPTPRRPSARRSGEDGEMLVKLLESPFYATGGGQVADTGVLECEGGGCRAQVTDVIRLGSDQVVRLAPEHGTFEPGERVVRPRRPAPRATPPPATTPPRTCCMPRCAAGWARMSTRPARMSARTSCASTSPTAASLSAEELQ